MKKSILIVCIGITALGLTAFGFVNWSETESVPIEVASGKVGTFDQLFPLQHAWLVADQPLQLS